MNRLNNKDQIFKVAIYLRLSKDDGDLSFSENGKAESNSIHNQRELLHNFLKQHPELELYDEYKDDGWTGTNFDRPGFNRMLEDIHQGKVTCVVVKDLSRFGRDYIDCGKYIEKIFPQLGVRFISVNDNYDTFAMSSSDNIVVPFKNLINDSYSRDISIKVRTNLEVKRRQGEFIGNFAVYGYMKDPDDKNHLIIDETAAAVVRDIFKWKIAGLSPGSIAVRLNQQGVLSPMEYKRSKGSNFQSHFKKSTTAKWSHVAVRRILQNEIYTGVLVQGKRTTPNHKTKKFIYRNKEEWVRVEDTHEAIISRAQFHLVQELLQEDTRAAEEDTAVHPYCGRIFCGDCGAPAVRKTVRSGNKEYVYYVCGKNKADRTVCSKHSIREDVLNMAVLATIRRQIEVILDMDRALQDMERLAWERFEIKKIDASIAIQEEIIEKNNELRMGTYEDFQAGILTRDEFVAVKSEFTARIAESQKAIERLTQSKSEIQQGLSEQQSWLNQFKEYENISDITRRVIVSLVERILVFEGNEIEVVFRYKDQLADIMAFLEAQNEKINIADAPKLEVV